MTDDILYRVEDRIGWITFNRPERRNALTLAMYARLKEICETVPQDGSVAALVIHGAGNRAFAAGTEIGEFRDFATPQDAHDYEANAEAVFSSIERCPVPTLAAITGACTGGGGAIAAACDLRLCDAALKFGFPIARTLGNCLAISNLARLSALMGQGRVREMMLTARLLGAEEAQRVGLVSEVLPDGEAVLARSAELARTLVGHAPLTLRATREGLRRLRVEGPGAADADLVELCYMSADFREGMEAFLSKRPPNWTGT